MKTTLAVQLFYRCYHSSIAPSLDKSHDHEIAVDFGNGDFAELLSVMIKTLLLVLDCNRNKIDCGPVEYAPIETLHRKRGYPMLQVDCLIGKVFEVFSNCETNPFGGFEVCFPGEIISPSLV